MKIDLSTVKVKNKLLVITYSYHDDIPNLDLSALSKEVKKNGGLGVVVVPKGSEISSMGVQEIESILKHMKEAVKTGK